MALYKSVTVTKSHQFNNTSVMINDVPIEGLNDINVEYDDDRSESFVVADGSGVLNENPSRKGVLTLQVLESSPSTDYLWDLYQTNETMTISGSDSAVEKFKLSVPQCKYQKAPPLKRSGEVDVVEWSFVAVYIEYRSGGYEVVES